MLDAGWVTVAVLHLAFACAQGGGFPFLPVPPLLLLLWRLLAAPCSPPWSFSWYIMHALRAVRGEYGRVAIAKHGQGWSVVSELSEAVVCRFRRIMGSVSFLRICESKCGVQH